MTASLGEFIPCNLHLFQFTEKQEVVDPQPVIFLLIYNMVIASLQLWHVIQAVNHISLEGNKEWI